MEGSLVAYTIFENGNVLNASQLNDNLMNQSVIVFPGDLSRDSAIPTPPEGMLTYLEDTNRYESYDGSEWVSPYGLTLVYSEEFTSASSITLDNIFTAEFDSYRLLLSFIKNTSIGGVSLALRAGGTTIAGTNYRFQGIRTFSTTVESQNNLNASALTVFGTSAVGSSGSMTADIINPFLPEITEFHISSNSFGGSNQVFGQQTAQEKNASSRDGILISSSAATITGSIQVYGYKKA
jgi:hypothetical protein